MKERILVRKLFKNKRNHQYSITLPKKTFIKVIERNGKPKKIFLDPKQIKIKVEDLMF